MNKAQIACVVWGCVQLVGGGLYLGEDKTGQALVQFAVAGILLWAGLA